MSDETKELRGTFRSIIENATLRAILEPSRRFPIELSPDERNALLEPFRGAIETDVEFCAEVGQQYAALALRGPVPLGDNAKPVRLSTKEGD